MDKRSGYSLEDDLMPIITGKAAVPNLKEIPLSDAVDNIAACYGPSLRGNVRLPSGGATWAHYFLDRGQGGGLEGSGLVIYYGGYGKGGQAAKFAICEHTKVEGAGADHRRGWHPGSCSKCGLDMTVDSGD